jgi:microprocessor complex subunit DGCR8
MPLYLHRHSRVCSLSRPYFLGPGSVRKHEIPITSIPCLNYQKALEKEKELIEQQIVLKEQQEREEASMVIEETNGTTDLSNGLSAMLNLNKSNQPSASKSHLPLIPNAKVETVAENLKAQSLTPVQFTDYCKKRFNFKTIRVMRFKSWSARRKFTKNRKHIKHLQRPTLPEGTKLITFPVLSAEIQDPYSTTPSTTQRPKKEWVMNPNGKTCMEEAAVVRVQRT